MKKVLLATAIAAVSTTAAMAEVSISDFTQGKVTALMTVANNFESRGINIVENSNKIAVHKTVNAWNQGWNALEDDNQAVLDGSQSITTLYLTNGSAITVATDNLDVDIATGTATVSTGEGVSYDLTSAEVSGFFIDSVSLRDSRADEVELVYNQNSVDYHIGTAGETGSNLAVSIRGNDTFDQLVDRVEAGIQKSYDSGFSDGYTAGYDDGFAAAKGVVKN